MGTIVKDAYDAGASATGLLAVRMLVAVALWGIVLNRKLTALPWRTPEVRRLASAAVIGIAVTSLSEYTAYRYLPVAFVVVILFMAPVWVALGEWALTRRGIGAGPTAGLIMLVVGLLLLTEISASRVSGVGIALALAASLGIAAFFMLGGSSVELVGSVHAAAVVAVAALFVVVPIALVDGTLLSSFTSSDVMTHGALLGLVGTTIALVLLFNGIKRLGAFPAAVMSAIWPIFAGLLAWWLLGDVLTPLQILGAGLMVAGTVTVEGSRGRARPSPRVRSGESVGQSRWCRG